MRKLHSGQEAQQAPHEGHFDGMAATPVGDQVAIERDRSKAAETIGELGLKDGQFTLYADQIEAGGLGQEIGVSLLSLPMGFTFASSPDEPLNDGCGSEHCADPQRCAGVARISGCDGGATASKPYEPEKPIEPVVQALVQSVENDAVLDVQDGFVSGALVELAGSSDAHVLPFGMTGGGLRDGGICDRPSPFSMGGPFAELNGVGAPTVAKCDRPPYPIVSVRYAEAGGGLTHKLAEVLSDYPGLETVRIRILTTGQVRHVHRNSVAWGLIKQASQPSVLSELKTIQRKLDRWELEHLREHAAALAELVEQLQAEVERLQNEYYAADARADMFLSLANEARGDVCFGITQAGEMGVVR